jgi:dienelactone hydrolase
VAVVFSFRLISTWIVIMSLSDVGLCAQALPDHPAEQASTQPVDRAGGFSIRRDELADIEGQDRFYWLALPTGYQAGDKPALIIVLHGTQTNARDMIKFWSGIDMRIPVILAAPQGGGRGWCSNDVEVLNAMRADLDENWSYDKKRTMLTGFSAGGTMSFHMVYAEGWEVTAVAGLGNYLPPKLKIDDIKSAKDMPVFYAVGMRDNNHERMRSGMRKLRSADCRVYLYRPPIKHRLDRKTTRRAMNWFFDLCTTETSSIIERSSNSKNPPSSSKALASIIDQAEWHESHLIGCARKQLDKIEEPGRNQLAASKKLIAAGRKVDAVDLLRTIEGRYGQSRLGRQARAKRLSLERQVDVRRILARREKHRSQSRAYALYLQARQYVLNQQAGQAMERCRTILRVYSETPAAVRARELLKQLKQEQQH